MGRCFGLAGEFVGLELRGEELEELGALAAGDGLGEGGQGVLGGWGPAAAGRGGVDGHCDGSFGLCGCVGEVFVGVEVSFEWMCSWYGGLSCGRWYEGSRCGGSKT